ncbi:MAG: ATP-binding protein [Fuerstiella sp.]
MKILSAKAQMTLGLVCLQISVLCGAMLFGFVPERKSAIMEGRADLCETVAIVATQLIAEQRVDELSALLDQMKNRNESLLSAAVRTEGGTLLAELGAHEAFWQRSGSRSTEDQVLVPIHAASAGGDADRWGAVELRFRPFSDSSLLASARHPWVRMTIIISCVTGLLFYFYLKKMLQHLDPSRAVPQRVREALDSLAEGLLVLDRDEKIVLANNAFAAWVGMPPDKLTGLPVASFDWVVQSHDQSLTGFPWADALQAEAAQAGIMIGLDRPDKVIQNLIANASPVLGHDGQYGGVLVSFDDVTQLEETRRDLKVARDQAESAQHEAEEANKAKSDFLARMSHEIRTPMNAILGYTEVLRTGHDEDIADRHKHLDTIHASGEHLLALINDILDLSKIESGQMDLDIQRHSLRDLVSQVVSVMDVKAKEKSVGLFLEADGLMPATIQTDAVRFRQAVFNLVGNAVKFTEEGCVRIVLSLTDDQKLKVDVVDTGVGIATDAVDKVFERFTQADASVSTKFGGTGLGLSISKQLARMMGGDITVTSELGVGSTFTLIVDPGSLDGIERIDPTQEAPAAARTKAADDTLQLPPCRILIVDDEKANRGLASIHIKRAGGTSAEACNGREAVDLLMQEEFDVVLMDFNMPVMGGLDATRELRRLGNNVPVIALTANVLEDDRQAAYDAGCNGFLTKPIRMADLVDGIRKLLPAVEATTADDVEQPAEPGEQTVEQTSEASDRSRAADDSGADEREPATTVADPAPKRGSAQIDDLLRSIEETLQRASQPADSKPPAAAGQTAATNNTAEEAEPAVAEQDRIVPAADSVPASDATESTEAPSAGVVPDFEPLESLLPVDDPEFYEIVADFPARLRQQVSDMRTAYEADNFGQLAELAHWLKGTGETLGFPDFTAPAAQLENLAKQKQHQGLDDTLQTIESLAERVVVRRPVADAALDGATG